MLDIRLLRENPDKVKKGVVDKQLDSSLVDKVLEFDQKRRDLLGEIEGLRAERNKLSKQGNEETRKQGKEIKQKLKEIEPELRDIKKEFEDALCKVPNLPANDVKVGKDESENEIIRKWPPSPEASASQGDSPTKFDFEPKSHWELGESLGVIDTDSGSATSGARFFYLKGDGVLLELALTQFAFEELIKEGFTPIIPPVIIKKASMKSMGYMEHGGIDDMYVLDKDDLVLVGTSEQSIGPLHTQEVLKKDELPKRYIGYSTCFRREAGSYGKDTKGAFRVHQFNKTEMFSFTTEDQSDKEHEYLLSLEEKFLQKLEIPYQVSKMCTGDLGFPAARKYDLEGWFPGEGRYRELTSTSNCTDFQARRLNIKYQEKGKKKFVHMLNGTAFSQRPILAILENYQQKDGSIVVPEVLKKWVGKEKIINRI